MAARSFQEAFETPALCRADVKSPLAKSLPGVHLDAAPSLRPAAGHGPAGSLAGSEGLPARCSQETSAPGRGLYTRGPGEAAASRRTDWRRGPRGGPPPGPGAGTHRVLGAEALHPELRGRRRLPADAAPTADSLGPGGQAGCRGAAPPRGRPRAPPAAPSAPARGPGSWRARDPPRSSSLRREACLVRGKGRGRLPSSAVAAAGMPT